MKLTKQYPIASFKALPEEGEGTFEAIVSVIGNVDLQGDRVMPHAFDKSIDRWQKSDNVLPVIWSHEWADPFAHIGYVNPTDMYEIAPGKAGALKGGLLVKGHLDVDKPFAKQVYDLLASRRVTEFSFAYDTIKEKRASDGANELHELELLEVGPTLKGANTETALLGVKARLDRAAREEHGTEVLVSDALKTQEYLGSHSNTLTNVVAEQSNAFINVVSEKAGRVIGAKAATDLKQRILDAVDEFVNEVNGGADEPISGEKELDPGDKKDFARGYADASAGRKSIEGEELTAEYVRGYSDGQSDRSNVENAEVQSLNAKLSELLEAK